jgi:hypothetical protein
LLDENDDIEEVEIADDYDIYEDVELTLEQEEELEKLSWETTENVLIEDSIEATFDIWEIENSNNLDINTDWIIDSNSQWVEINNVWDELEEIEEKIESETDLEHFYLDNNDQELEVIELDDEEKEDEVQEEENVYNEDVVEIEESELPEEEEVSEEWWIAIANTYNCTTYVWSQCKYRFRKSRRYKQVHTQKWIAKWKASKRYAYIYWTKVWTTQIKYYKWSRNPLTINVEVLPKPKPFYKKINIWLSDTSKLNIAWAKYMSYSYSTRRVVSVSKSSNYINVLWKKIWTTKVYVRNRWLHVGTIEVNVTPPVVTETIIEWQSFAKRMRRANRSKYEFSDNSLASLKTSKSYYQVNTKKSGTLYIKISNYRWNPRYILKLIIEPKPEPKIYDVNLEQGKTTKMYLPISNWKKYRFKKISTNGANIQASWYNWNINIRWKSRWNVALQVYDKKTSIHYYTVNVKVTPRVPTIIEQELYKGKYLSIDFYNRNNSSYSFSDKTKVKLYTRRSRIKLYWKETWNTQLYIKQWEQHLYTYNITVKEQPKPEEYNKKMYVWDWLWFKLPEIEWWYKIKVWQSSLFYKSRIRQRNWYFSFQVIKPWKTTIKISEKIGNRFIRYILHIESVPRERNYSLNKTDWLEIYYNRKYDFKINGYDILKRKISKGDQYVYWKKVWTTKINAYYNWNLRKVFNIEVKPIPEPIELTCNIIVWKRCYFNIPNDWYSYIESRDNMVEIKRRKPRIRVKWKWSWVLKIQVKSNKWNYITHNLTINIASKAVKKYDCEVLEWSYCDSYKTYEKSWYTFWVSDNWIVKVSKLKYDKNNKKVYQYRVKWIQEWKTEVYIYRYWEHIATINTAVHKDYDMTLANRYIKIYQWETKTLELKNWTPRFLLSNVNKELASTSINRETWVLTITWKKVWKIYPQIKDKYQKRLNLLIKVKDVDLELDTYELNLKEQEEWYISYKEYYKWIKKVEKSNNNVLVYNHVFQDKWKWLRIKAVKRWETIIRVTDLEGNQRTVKVTVKQWTSSWGGSWKTEGWGEWNNIKKELNITNLEYTKEVEKDYVWWLYFESTWDITKIWYDYIYSLEKYGNVEYDNKNWNNKHSVVLVQQCMDWCNFYIRPYIIWKNWKKKYHEYTEYYGFKKIVYAWWNEDKLVAKENYKKAKKDWVKINALPLIPFLVILWLVWTASCVDDICPVIPLWIGWSTWRKVLDLANKLDVEKTVIRLWDDAKDLWSKISQVSRKWKVLNIEWSKVPKPDLNKIKNEKLKNIVQELYRNWAKIWNWSTADAIRYEKATLILVWWKSHILKWKQRLRQIEKWLKSNANEYNKKATDYEIDIAKKIKEDLFKAIYN